MFVAGHNGMVGSAIVRQLDSDTSVTLITRTRSELDLQDQAQVEYFMRSEKPDQVILAAAKVGGIMANNNFPAEFIYENLMIQTNVTHQSYLAGVKELLFLGSSCIYPRDTRQPICEAALLTGRLEKTNEPYAVAKIAGIKLCESYSRQYGVSYRSVMPTNLYGPGDNFHHENSHVIPALLRRFHQAKTENKKQVSIWGSGCPKREFLHVDDMAKASLFLMNLDQAAYSGCTTEMESHVNVGSGAEISIRELADLIAEITDYKGEITFDTSKPDGSPRKLLDSSRLKELGWSSTIELREGLERTYLWFLQCIDSGKWRSE